MPREDLKKVMISGNPSYYVEKVESIKIFPELDKIEVQTQRWFYNSHDTLVRAEDGVKFEIRYTLPEGIYNQIVGVIKQKRPKDRG